MTPVKAFGLSAVITFLLTLVFVFVLLLCGQGNNSIAMAFTGGILAIIQGVFWAFNR